MGFLEFVVIGIVALVVFGPEKLPKVIYDVSQMWRNLRRGATQIRQEFEQTVAADIKADLHNSNVMETLEQQKIAVEETLKTLDTPLSDTPFALDDKEEASTTKKQTRD